MRTSFRTALVIGIAITGLAASGAHAATKKPTTVKKVCNLVVDPADDTTPLPVAAPGGPQDSGMDILSGDVATNATTVTGVVRVKTLGSSDPMSPLGQNFTMLFSAAGGDFQLFLAGGRYPTGNKFDFGYLDTSATPNTYTSLGQATGVFDSAKNEVRISAPIAKINEAGHGAILKGKKITGLTATTGRFTGQEVADRPAGVPSTVPFFHGLVSQVDITDAGKSYLPGTPSCVTVGK